MSMESSKESPINGSTGSRKDVETTVLALETGTERLGVAVTLGGSVVSEITLERRKAHSSMLLPLAIEALQKACLEPGDLTCIAVSRGPGSFTGLRIGAATAQGLSVALGKPVVMVPSFQVLLRQAQGHPNVAIASGRSASQAVSAAYSQVDGIYREVVSFGARDLEELHGEVERLGLQEIFVAGDAALDFVRLVGREGAKKTRMVPLDPYWALPRAGVMGLIARKMFEDGVTTSPGDIVPEYVRKSQAEVVASKRRLLSESKGEQF